MTINIYTKAEVDAHLALLASHANAIQDAIDNNWDFGFNYADGVQDLNKSKRIIEQEAEIGGDVLLILDDCGDTTNIENWIENVDGLNPVDETTLVKQGSHSMKLGVDADKDAEDRAYWQNTQAQGDLSAYQHDWLYLWVYFPTLDYVPASGNVALFTIGSASGNRVYFMVDRAALSVGWNLLKFDLDNPDGTVGTVNWAAIAYMYFLIYEKPANTNDFTICLDSLMFVRPYD